MDLSSINWGSVADWASAFGSVSAAGVALYLASASQRVNLSVTCGERVMIGGGTQPVRLASIMVVNTGGRQVRISNISLRHGLLKKSYGIIKIGSPTEHCESLLRVLNDGDQAHFGFPLDSETNWVSGITKEFRSWLDLATFRVTIHCSNGQSVTVKPEQPLLEIMRIRMRMIKRSAGESVS